MVSPSPSASDSDNLGFHWSVNDGVVSGVGRKWKRSDSSDFRVRRAYDSAYDSDFGFSKGHKRSFDSANDSDSDSDLSLVKTSL